MLVLTPLWLVIFAALQGLAVAPDSDEVMTLRHGLPFGVPRGAP